MIPLPLKLKIVQEKNNVAVFNVEGLYPGYGVTLGNSLRRVLLSSLEGAAITQVKIKGALHEFSTIPGVLEDVVLIILHLKKLRFRLFSKEAQTARLLVRGEKEVKGKDFKLPPQIKLANPEEHIATLTKSSSQLDIEIKIEKGIGYLPSEIMENEKPEVGAMFIDAIFTPVKRVKFSVENMRVGKRTDFDKLKLEIETDGTVSPKEAIIEASKILIKHFSLIPETFSTPAIAPGQEIKQGRKHLSPKKEIAKSSGKKEKSRETKNQRLKSKVKSKAKVGVKNQIKKEAKTKVEKRPKKRSKKS